MFTEKPSAEIFLSSLGVFFPRHFFYIIAFIVVVVIVNRFLFSLFSSNDKSISVNEYIEMNGVCATDSVRDLSLNETIFLRVGRRCRHRRWWKRRREEGDKTKQRDEINKRQTEND